MQRSDFTALPLGIALGIVWDALQHVPHGAQFLESLPVPEKPRSPKYDFRIGRKAGTYQWASETDLEGLRYWHAKYSEGAALGGKYAEKDRKRAESLARWIAYREADPTSAWSGIRDDAQATAHAPLARPMVHEYAERKPAPAAAPGNGYGAEYDADNDDDPIPF